MTQTGIGRSTKRSYTIRTETYLAFRSNPIKYRVKLSRNKSHSHYFSRPSIPIAQREKSPKSKLRKVWDSPWTRKSANES